MGYSDKVPRAIRRSDDGLYQNRSKQRDEASTKKKKKKKKEPSQTAGITHIWFWTRGWISTYKKPNAKIRSNMIRCDSVAVMRITTGTGSANIKKSVAM